MIILAWYAARRWWRGFKADLFAPRRTTVVAAPRRRPGSILCHCGGYGCPSCGWSGWT